MLVKKNGMTEKKRTFEAVGHWTLPEHKTSLHLSNARTYIFPIVLVVLSALRSDVLLSESIFNKPAA